jgi:TetR/AcrR family transcriptional regulator, repressor of fatR-cypB operon
MAVRIKNRQEKSDKREAILEAMLDLIAERGFHNAPMSVLAQRSGASPGVIYHYFHSKNDLIHALYERVASVKREALLSGYSEDMPPHEAFVQLALNTYHFYRTHLREVRFLDQYVNSPYCNTSTAGRQAEQTKAHLLAWFQPKKRGGVLKDLPPEAINSLTFGLVASLAKVPKGFSATTLKNVAETVWSAISDE